MSHGVVQLRGDTCSKTRLWQSWPQGIPRYRVGPGALAPSGPIDPVPLTCAECIQWDGAQLREALTRQMLDPQLCLACYEPKPTVITATLAPKIRLSCHHTRS